jgi:uncharacterized protein GlcG (DUF336 family)
MIALEPTERVIAAAKGAIGRNSYPPTGISVVDDAAHLVAVARMASIVPKESCGIPFS